MGYDSIDQKHQKEVSKSKNQTINIILSNFKRKQMLPDVQNEALDVESNQSVQFQYLSKSFSHEATKIYQELMQSHQLAKDFIQELGGLRTTPIIQSLAKYCRDVKLGQKGCDTILDFMEARLTKMVKNNRIKKNWSTEDLQILVWILSKYMERNGIQTHELLTREDWTFVARMIPGSTYRSCMFKFVSLKKFKLAHHKWEKEEETLLLRTIEQLGVLNWKLIAEKLYDTNSRKNMFRTAKQCREHWSCYLDPKIKKGPWQKEEDCKLLQIVLESNCLKRWSAIKFEFEGRTQNALKNRFNLLIQKQKKASPQKSQKDLIMEILKEQQKSTPTERTLVESPVARSSSIIENPIARQSFVPLIPEERRNYTIPYHPGVIIFFGGNNYLCE